MSQTVNTPARQHLPHTQSNKHTFKNTHPSTHTHTHWIYTQKYTVNRKKHLHTHIRAQTQTHPLDMQAPSDERYIYNKWVSSFNGLFLLFHFVSFLWCYQYSYVHVTFIQTLSFIWKLHAWDCLISFHTQLLTWHFNHHSKVQSFMVAYSIDQSVYCHEWTNMDLTHKTVQSQLRSLSRSLRSSRHFRPLVLFFSLFIHHCSLKLKANQSKIFRQETTKTMGWKIRFQQKWTQTEIVVLIQAHFFRLPQPDTLNCWKWYARQSRMQTSARSHTHSYRHTQLKPAHFDSAFSAARLVHWTLFNVMAIYLHCQRFCEPHMCYFKHFNVSIGRERGRNRQCISKFCFLAQLNQCVQWALSPVFWAIIHFSSFFNGRKYIISPCISNFTLDQDSRDVCSTTTQLGFACKMIVSLNSQSFPSPAYDFVTRLTVTEDEWESIDVIYHYIHLIQFIIILFECCQSGQSTSRIQFAMSCFCLLIPLELNNNLNTRHSLETRFVDQKAIQKFIPWLINIFF